METEIDIKWDESLSVGVEAIDNDHKELINLFNQLYASCSAPEGTLIATEADTLARLLDYTKHHFQREETLMRQEDYPDYAFHKELHDDLLLITLNFQEQLQSSEIHEITDETLEFLRSWIVNHIMAVDMEFANYMKLKAQRA
jgi:hemerythrin-like metal-binding protein